MSGQDLALIAEEVSPEAARALVRVFGGDQIYLPVEPDENHRLTAALGLEVARAVCRLLGPGHLDVPLGAADRQRLLGRRILELSRKGWSAGRIARELGCSRRTVFKWRSRAKRWQG